MKLFNHDFLCSVCLWNKEACLIEYDLFLTKIYRYCVMSQNIALLLNIASPTCQIHSCRLVVCQIAIWYGDLFKYTKKQTYWYIVLDPPPVCTDHTCSATFYICIFAHIQRISQLHLYYQWMCVFEVNGRSNAFICTSIFNMRLYNIKECLTNPSKPVIPKKLLFLKYSCLAIISCILEHFKDVYEISEAPPT